MTLAGELPTHHAVQQAFLNDIVHDHQIACCDQRHEAGNEPAVALDPVINPRTSIRELFRPDVSDDVFWKAIEFRREIFPVHFQTPARLLVLSHPENGHHAPQLVRESTEIGLAFRSQYNYEVRA